MKSSEVHIKSSDKLSIVNTTTGEIVLALSFEDIKELTIKKNIKLNYYQTK